MFKAPRGTADVLPNDQPYWHHIVQHAEALCHRYGYQRIDTPLFEESGLFQRSIGEGTDIVEKETYTFEDRSADLLTLRPEGTAPVCRSYLEHGMHNLPQPVKLYYIAPSFRYERPQAGRYRQFHQFGYEALGELDPALDAEVITMAWQFYHDLGIGGLTVLLNSIGDSTCRPGFISALAAYYQPLADRICRDCQVRLVKNPLRLLDCKQGQCQSIIQGAPHISDHLCQACREHFSAVRSYLDAVAVPYAIEHRLVRGLDYYTKTVFEVVPADAGAQGTVGAGGRYDGLIEALGGRPTPGIGFAAGIERVVLNMKKAGIEPPNRSQPQVCVVHLGAEAKLAATRLAHELRLAGLHTVLSVGDRSMRAQLRYANSLGVAHALILGEDEVTSGTVVVRSMAEGAQETVPQAEVGRHLQAGQ